MKDRLIELIKEVENNPEKICPHYLESDCYDCPYDIEGNCNNVERKADYLLANGVIVPPCKVGDKVYWVVDNITDRNIKEFCITYDEKTDFGVCEFTVYGFMRREDNSLRICIEEIEYYTVFFLYEKDIGKTVFLTKAEAYKEFAERLNKELEPQYFYGKSSITYRINNLLKELVGDEQ